MGIIDRIKSGIYDMVGNPPISPPRPIPVFMFGSDTACSSDYRAHADALDAWQLRMKEYEIAMSKWCAEQDRLMLCFANDLAEENGMLGHPKQELLYQMALKHSHYHTKGLLSVIVWYEEFLPLVK